MSVDRAHPASVERSEREQILEAFYDSITGILFLHDEGRMGHASILGEVRHSTQRCEQQLFEIEDAEVRALSEEDDHVVASVGALRRLWRLLPGSP